MTQTETETKPAERRKFVSQAVALVCGQLIHEQHREYPNCPYSLLLPNAQGIPAAIALIRSDSSLKTRLEKLVGIPTLFRIYPKTDGSGTVQTVQILSPFDLSAAASLMEKQGAAQGTLSGKVVYHNNEKICLKLIRNNNPKHSWLMTVLGQLSDPTVQPGQLITLSFNFDCAGGLPQLRLHEVVKVYEKKQREPKSKPKSDQPPHASRLEPKSDQPAPKLKSKSKPFKDSTKV